MTIQRPIMLPWIRVVLDQSFRRIAHDLEFQLCPAVADNVPKRKVRLRRRLAEPPIELSRPGTSILQGPKAWENYEHRSSKRGLPAPLRKPIGTSIVQRSEQPNSVCCSVSPKTYVVQIDEGIYT